MIEDFAAGIALGLGVAAPIGPIGLLCIRRTLEHGFAAGIAGGLGTALADALYAAIAAFGISTVATAVAAIQIPLRLFAVGAFLWLAVSAWRRPPTAEAAVHTRRANIFAQTFVLTLANPATILTFAAVFAGLAREAAQAAALVAGAFTGSLLWWVLLSAVVAGARRRITPHAMTWINRGAAVLFVAFAALVVLRL